MDRVAQHWVNIGMPHRPPVEEDGGLYNAYMLRDLPPLDVLPEFQCVTTLDDIDMGHQQLLVWVWVFILQMQHGRVYTYSTWEKCVANSLPEFLTRMYVENLAWFYLHKPEKYEKLMNKVGTICRVEFKNGTKIKEYPKRYPEDETRIRSIVEKYVQHMRAHYPQK